MGRTLILGASGMLGSQVHNYLQASGFQASGTLRAAAKGDEHLGKKEFSVETFPEEFFAGLGEEDWVINCIGIVKSRIITPSDKVTAVQVNSFFPHQLDQAAEKYGFKVLQIATDCVYSGKTGRYSEDSPHSPTDVYGMSKSLGEVRSPRFMNLRCSIIGPEPNGNSSLLEWVRSRPIGSEIHGYVNHIWNGVTTLAFAKVVAGIIENDFFEAGTFHLLPRNVATKEQLVRLIASRLGREDLTIIAVTAGELVERSLKTNHPDMNERLWRHAGYKEIPTIQELVQECPIVRQDSLAV